MVTVRGIIVKLGFKVEHEKLEKVEEQLEKIKSRLEFLGTVEIAKGIIELGEKFSKFAEDLHVAAESAGITVEEFQRLAVAAGQSAISQEEMGQAMFRLSRHLYDARRGGAEAQKAFAAVGFNGNQVARFKTSRDALLALSDRFRQIQDPIKKQALAQELLGRGSVSMVAFLSKGSGAIRDMGREADKLGVVLSKDQVEALVSVEHSLMKLWAVLKNVGATIAVYLAPIINTGVMLFTKFYSANKKILEANVKKWAEDLAFSLGFLHGILQGVIGGFLRFALAHQLLVTRVFEILAVLGTLATTVLFVQKAFSIVTEVFSVLRFLLPVLTYGFEALGVVIGILTSPIGLIVLGIGALVVAIHDLWTVMSGGKFEDTWVGKAWEAMKGLGGKVAGFFGFGGDEKKASAGEGAAGGSASGFSALQNLGNVASLGSGGPQVSPVGTAAAAGGKGADVSISAPLTIQAAPGMDENKLAQFANEKHKEHMDRVHREAARSLTPVLAQ